MENGALDATILSPTQRELLSNIEAKVGICSRCDWRTGCDRCDVSKCLRYLLVDELMAPEPRERGRPKAKAAK